MIDLSELRDNAEGARDSLDTLLNNLRVFANELATKRRELDETHIAVRRAIAALTLDEDSVTDRVLRAIAILNEVSRG